MANDGVTGVSCQISWPPILNPKIAAFQLATCPNLPRSNLLHS